MDLVLAVFLACLCISHIVAVNSLFSIVPQLANKKCTNDDLDFEIINSISSLISCVFACSAKPTCYSVFYAEGTGTCMGCKGIYQSTPEVLTDHGSQTVHAAIEIECGQPNANIETIISALPDTKYGSSATYACATGYDTFTGDQKRMCQLDGTWSGTAPTCTGKDCGPPPTGFNLNGYSGNNLYPVSYTITCTKCTYSVIGGNTLSCQSDGLWTTDHACVTSTEAGYLSDGTPIPESTPGCVSATGLSCPGTSHDGLIMTGTLGHCYCDSVCCDMLDCCWDADCPPP